MTTIYIFFNCNHQSLCGCAESALPCSFTYLSHRNFKDTPNLSKLIWEHKQVRKVKWYSPEEVVSVFTRAVAFLSFPTWHTCIAFFTCGCICLGHTRQTLCFLAYKHVNCCEFLITQGEIHALVPVTQLLLKSISISKDQGPLLSNWAT